MPFLPRSVGFGPTESPRSAPGPSALTRLFEEGAGADIPQVRHTIWAGYKAVSEWIDHHRPTRGRDDADRAENRLSSSLFGTGARLKARAFELAHDMATHGGTITATTPTPAHEEAE